MFSYQIIQLLSLLALASGTGLYAWGAHKGGKGTRIAKVFGIIIMIFSAYSFVVSNFYGIKLWYKEHPATIQQHSSNCCCMHKQ